MTTFQLMTMIMPLIILQVSLIVVALIQLIKHGHRNLNKVTWACIILFVTTLGPIAFLLFGRQTNDYD